MRRWFLGYLALCCFSAGLSAYEYQKKPGVAGTITSVGSDTMAGLMGIWSQEFKRLYPHVKFQLQAAGSGTAPPALTEGVASVGPMSRALKDSEIAYFYREHQYKPTTLTVAMDAITLFVSLDNPLESLSLQQIDAVFSTTRFCGGKADIRRWSQLLPRYPQVGAIKLYGRNAVSGTYSLFKNKALCHGDFKTHVNELPNSASVIQSVANSEIGLGYATFGHINPGVKTVAVAMPGQSPVVPSMANISSNRYPLSRTLYIVINKAPKTPLPDITREFLLFIMSQQGQKLVRREGYVPVSAAKIKRQARLINLGAELP